MRSNKSVLLCTVGTSLLESNLRVLPSNTTDRPSNWEQIYKNYQTKNWNKLAQELARIDPSKRICGAEINTINDLITLKKVPLEEIHFLVSDTETGRETGTVLEQYFTSSNPIKKIRTHIHTIEQLQDKDPKAFKVQGLRNLVRTIGGIVSQEETLTHSIIDATGGYKAQIAIAVIMGQLLKIPVMYKHERFEEIIDFPPLPISFDYSLLGAHADLLSALERNHSFSHEDILSLLDGNDQEQQRSFENLRVFFTEVSIDDSTTMYELSPIGQVYITSYRTAFPKTPISLQPLENRKKPTFGNDHHYPDRFKEFVNKIWNEKKWIHTIYSTDYNGQKGIHGIHFAIKTSERGTKLMGTFKTNDFGARFVIELKDETPQTLCWAADYLNTTYGNADKC